MDNGLGGLGGQLAEDDPEVQPRRPRASWLSSGIVWLTGPGK